MKKIGIITGVNLNLLGKRETDIYGNTSFEQYFKQLKGLYPQMELSYYQSNIEGALVSQLQEWGFTYDGIVLNAGAYTHTSIALADAIKAITTPVVEVHISNTFAREAFRHHSYLSPVMAGIIVGFGLKSYNLAIESFI